MRSLRRFPFKYLLIIVFIVFAFFIWNRLFSKEIFSVQPRTDKIAVQSFNEEKNDFQTIGWVRVQGTSLDMPIVHSEQKNYNYQVRTKSYSWSNVGDNKFHNVLTIMGHNIYNLSSTPKFSSDKFYRFEELMSFVYYDFAKDNEYFQITIGNKDYVYKIFAVSFFTATDSLYFPVGMDYDENDMRYYVSYIKEHSFYNYKVPVNGNDSVASLVTCTRFFGADNPVELYVTGRLLRKGERMSHYRVLKNKSYADIENVLRGDFDEKEDEV